MDIQIKTATFKWASGLRLNGGLSRGHVEGIDSDIVKYLVESMDTHLVSGMGRRNGTKGRHSTVGDLKGLFLLCKS